MFCNLLRFSIASSCLALLANAQAPNLVDVTASGHAASSGAKDASISADGRFVAFASDSPDLVAADSNGVADVFLCDRDSGALVRASVATGGAESHPAPTSFGYLSVASPVVSRDGRFVAFVSNAADLVAGDTNASYDVFVRDIVAGTTERVSVSSTGAQVSGNSGAFPYQHFGNPTQEYQRSMGLAMTPDGRFVAFSSLAPDLVPGLGPIPQQDVYVHDRTSGVTELVSANVVGWSANAACWFPSISDDGRYVAFDSPASDLVDGDSNGVSDVFVHDRTLGVTVRASLGTSGQEANGASGFLFDPYDNSCSCTLVVPLGSKISADGRWIAFGSRATNLGSSLASPANVFLRDRVANVTSLISANTAGTGGDGSSLAPAVSADGRYVAYVSSARDIAPVGDVGGDHVLVRDRLIGTTRLASAGPGGAPVYELAKQPSISADGDQLTFTTSAQLVLADQNAVEDVYASGTPVVPFTDACSGSAATCPCGNAGAAGAGCANSFEPLGSRLIAAGNPSVSQDSLVLIARRLVPGTGVLFVQSGTSFTTATAPAFGDGVRCVGGNVLRLFTRLATGDTAMLGTGGDARVSTLGQVPAVGGVRFYQACYRNTLQYCTSGTLNSTNSIRVSWNP